MDVSIETQKRTTAILIANPNAGSYSQNAQQIEEAIAYLNERQWDIELKLTQEKGDARKFAREAVEQHRAVVIVVGGDGTINEVIQELAGSETALGVLPSGTVNVWARETGIAIDDFEAAREVLLSGKLRRIDLGEVNDRYFLLMSTIGFDAEVTRTVEKKKRLGVLDYILKGTWLGLSYPNFTALLQTGKRAVRVHALQIIFGNTQLYAGAIKFTWQARSDDGLLDICVVRSQNVFGRLGVLFAFLLRQKQRQRWVMYEASKEIKVHTTQPVAIQVDGDPAGYTAQKGFPPTTFRVVPGALKVIVPEAVPEPLFTKPPES
jgi:diacylglycerol kinase (ATP)